MYKNDFVDFAETYHDKLKFIFGINSKDVILKERNGLMLFEYISKSKGYYIINRKKVTFEQGDAFLFKPWEEVKIVSTEESAERIFLAYTPHLGDSVSELLDKNCKYSGAYCKEMMFNFFEMMQSEKVFPESLSFLMLANLSLCINKPSSQKEKDRKNEELYNKRVP